MPTDATTPAPNRRRRRPRLLRSVLALLFLAAVAVAAFGPLHHPLIRRGVNVYLARENLRASWTATEPLWRAAAIRDFDLSPTGPHDIQRVRIASADLRWDYGALLRGHFYTPFRTVTARDIEIRIKPLPPAIKDRRRPRKWAINWDEPFRLLFLFAPTVDARGFTLHSDTPDGEFAVENAAMRVDAHRGRITADRWKIPFLPEWRNLAATVTNTGARIVLTELQLAPDTAVDHFELDQKQRAFRARGRLLGGEGEVELKAPRQTATGTAWFRGVSWPIPPVGPADLSGTFVVAPASVSGTFAVVTGTAPFAFDGGGAPVAFAEGKADVTVFKRLLPRPVDFRDGLEAAATASVGGATFRQIAVDRIEARAAISGGRFALESLRASRGSVVLTGSGSLLLPEKIIALGEAPFDCRFLCEGNSVGDLRGEPDLAGPNFTGRLDATLGRGPAGLVGRGALAARDLAWNGVSLGSGTADLQIAGGKLIARDTEWRLGEMNRLQADLALDFGTARLSGWIAAHVADPAFINELARPQFPDGLVRGGTAALAWSGTADTGTFSLAADGLALGASIPMALRLSGSHASSSVEVPAFEFRAGPTRLAATVSWNGRRIRAEAIQLDQANTRVLSGFAALPFRPNLALPPRQWFPPDGRVAANLRATGLDLTETARAFSLPGRVSGTLDASLSAGGSLGEPAAVLRFDARGIAHPALGPQTLGLRSIAYIDHRSATLSATLSHPRLQPITLSGSAPVDLASTLRDPASLRANAFSLSADLPPTDLAGLRELVPDIRFIQCNARARLQAVGPMAQLRLSGSAAADLEAIRFNNPALPPVDATRFRLALEGDRLVIREAGGTVAGGKFDLKGRVGLADPRSPTLDLDLVTSDALLIRNNSVTARGNARLRAVGPWNAATLSGSLAVTRGRFFREIEILPIQLPGKPAPKPRTSRPGFSITTPPLRDWKFDVAVTTEDPFLVTGNLANGEMDARLRLRGSGFAPTLEGEVLVDRFTATLPFSRLSVDGGRINFRADQPFVPLLDLRATGMARSHELSVYLSGNAFAPTTIFASEPPLPQEDILSLLAAGTTSGELASDSNAVTGRAAVLAAQSIFRKIFKRAPDFGPEPIRDRFDLEIGGVDPRTGYQEVSARFRATEHVAFIGELDVQGNARGQVQYLIRFR